jgi:nucleoside-diphosphate-sugar epimerase
MNVLITGGGGFLGHQLATTLQQRGKLGTPGGGEAAITSITLADLRFPPSAAPAAGPAITAFAGDLGDAAFVAGLVKPDTDAIFHLAAMVSGDGERDFDGCLRANLDGTRHLLEAARRTGRRPRVVFASSLAVFGGHTIESVVSDRTKAVPQTTYGMTKLIGELFINDYSRRGFIDGRAARLPTIFIRPGKPNAALSSFASSLFREPLNGQPCHLPVERTQQAPLLSYRRVIDNLIRLAEVDGALFGSERTVTLPSTLYRIDQMIAALERVAARHGIRLGPIVDQPDPLVRKVVAEWPVGTDATRVPGLGLVNDPPLEEVIEQYLADFGPTRPKSA